MSNNVAQFEKKTVEQADIIDRFEEQIVSLGDPVSLPLRHIFTKGLYAREIFIPAGSLLTSQEHKTQHQFIISKGEIRVFTDDDKVITLRAPYIGITEPGTRRALHAVTDTVWTTFHPTDKTEVDEIENEILGEHDNPLVDDETYEKNHSHATKDNQIINGQNKLEKGVS